MLKKQTFALSTLAIAICSLSVTGFAQSKTDTTEAEIEVITVKGDFNQTPLQKLANSVSILSQNEIAQLNVENFEELAAITPNINFSSGSQRARYYQIRGIGERSQFQTPINPSVGVVVDDIDFSGIGGAISTFDLAQVEVFRGPQGTRFGANALAGLIYMQSAAPTDAFSSRIKVSAGNYNSYSTGIMVSGPANDKVGYRLSAERYKSDGFIHNSFLKRDDTNNRDELSLKAKVKVDVSNQLNFDVNAYYLDFDNGYDAFSLDNSRETWSDTPGYDKQRTRALSSHLNYTGLTLGNLTAIVSYANSDLAYGYDEDWSYVGFHPWEYASQDAYLRDRSIATQELRLSSKPEQKLFGDTTDWLFGVYLKQDDVDLHRQYTYLAEDFIASFNTNTAAVYGQLDTQLDNWHITTGLRYEQRNADYENNEPYNAKADDTMLGGNLVVSYQLDDSLIYGEFSRGFKAGGANITNQLTAQYRHFSPEYTRNYELGYKQTLAEQNAYFRAAVFYMQRDDIQLSSSATIKREDGSEAFIPYIANASSGWNKGIEFESGWQLTDAFSLTANFGLLDSEYQAYIDASNELRPNRQQAHAPNYQAYIAADYVLDDNWTLHLSASAKDSFYFSDSHDQQGGQAFLVNASAQYQLNQWQLTIWTRNLFDRDVATRGFYFGNDPRDGYTAKTYTQLAEPRVFGVSLNYEF